MVECMMYNVPVFKINERTLHTEKKVPTLEKCTIDGLILAMK